MLSRSGSGYLLLIAQHLDRIGHARCGAGVVAVRLEDILQELLLVGAGFLRQRVIHIAQVENFGVGSRESGPLAEHVADAFAYGVHVDRRIHLHQVHAHVHTDHIGHRIGVGLELHAPARLFFEQAPASSAAAVRTTNVLRISGSFFEKISISRLPATAAAVEPIRIAILPRSIRSVSV